MSRTKREKSGSTQCDAENISAPDEDCPHICRKAYRHEDPEHFCCNDVGGRFTDDDLYGD